MCPACLRGKVLNKWISLMTCPCDHSNSSNSYSATRKQLKNTRFPFPIIQSWKSLTNTLPRGHRRWDFVKSEISSKKLRSNHQSVRSNSELKTCWWYALWEKYQIWENNSEFEEKYVGGHSLVIKTHFFLEITALLARGLVIKWKHETKFTIQFTKDIKQQPFPLI